MSTRRIPDGLLIALALPAYAIWHVARYASVQEGWPAKIGMFITFVPVIAIISLMWFGAWAMAIALLRAAIHP
jgi:hypothetical protein